MDYEFRIFVLIVVDIAVLVNVNRISESKIYKNIQANKGM